MQVKKHIPNTLTLGNLLCGCLALVQVLQNKDIQLACLLMVISLVCDFFDGFLARKLNVSSPIGRELDSLADMVTFGVLPAAILSYIIEYQAGITSYLKFFPYLIALFSALRLAKFNIDTRQSDSFIGLNTPANSILIAAIALNLIHSTGDWLSSLFRNHYFVISFVIISSYLLVAELPMFAFKFKNFSWKGNEIRFGFLAFAALILALFQLVGIPWIILAYILLSL
ncbi:MAG: CDP-diacylglycerol--serine O-phosphatidyltransferase, partial [Bacteroidota bacterium]